MKTVQLRVGRAWNGGTIGGGYDCAVLQRTTRSALVVLFRIATSETFYAEWELIADDLDLDALARSLGGCPCTSDPDQWVSSTSDPDEYERLRSIHNGILTNGVGWRHQA